MSPNEALLREIATGAENPYADREPQSANEYWLKKIAGEEVSEDSPFNREPQSANEYWLKEIYENGGAGGGTVTVIEEQEFTGEQQEGFYFAVLTAEPFSESPITVTFDGDSYEVESNGEGIYGDFDEQTDTPIFNEYPFTLAVSDRGVMVAVADGETHTIEATAKASKPTGTVSITDNGTYNVTRYAEADMNVPASAVVSGTKNITTNGETDVTNYQKANVAVPASAVDTGKKSITNNGTDIDVVGYAAVDVAVPASAVVSGTKQITENGTNIDVTDYAAVDVAVPAGATIDTIEITFNNNSSNGLSVFGTNQSGKWTYSYVPAGDTVTLRYPAYESFGRYVSTTYLTHITGNISSVTAVLAQPENQDRIELVNIPDNVGWKILYIYKNRTHDPFTVNFNPVS